jgi:hypothetical protein
MGGRRGASRDTVWGFKNFAGGSRPRVKKILRKIRERLATLDKLGRWERLTLVCVQELGLEYQFRIADIVTCIERKYGIQNHGGHLNRKIFDAVKRLVDRKVVVKKDRGVYALRRNLATVSALGFPLVKEFVAFPFLDTEKCREMLMKTVKNHVTSSSKNTENLYSHGMSCSSYITSNNSSNSGGSATTSTTGSVNNTKVSIGECISSNNGGNTEVSTSGVGLGRVSVSAYSYVVRVHVVKPRNGWIGYYESISAAYYVLDYVRDFIRKYLVELYGESFVESIDEFIETVVKSLPSAKIIMGCHGRYNFAPDGFRPLNPNCEVHSYEYGIDLSLPAELGILHDISFTKIYVKELMKGTNPSGHDGN